MGLIAWLAITFAAGFVGSRFETGPWYEGLIKPDWTPPPGVFPPVWMTLYVLMAVAAWLVWRQGGFKAARVALTFYLIQLVANALWSWLFFGRERIDQAMLDVVILWLLIAITTLLFFRHRRLAGVLMVPYLAWVTFAAALNWTLLQLNGPT